MACTSGTCSPRGTSGITCGSGIRLPGIPVAGDPDNNIYLSANGVSGGVELSWNYPALNPAAVSHFKVFRGITGVFADAVEKVIVAGSSYFDKISVEEIRRYFYWIQVVSIQGTTMEPIGPAMATPLSKKVDVLESLTAEIDEGHLATSLRERIQLLEVLQKNLAQETIDRALANQALADALASVQSDTDLALTYVQNEITERTSADEALVTAVEALSAGLGENAAAIVEEKTIRATETESLANQVNILYVTTEANQAAILHEQQARTTELEAMAQDVQTLASQSEATAAALLEEKTVRATADKATANQLTAVVSQLNNTGAAVQTEAATRADADKALASSIQTAQTTLNGNIASVQTTLQTQISTVNGVVNNIGALYTAKVDVNGLVGGFGVYNTGQSVEACFDVDRFWVGRTLNRVKPFIVDNNVVYIDKARIRNADIDTLKLAGNSVTVSQYGYGQLYQPGGYLFTNTSWRTIASMPLSLQGMAPSEAAGTIIIGTANIWEGGGSAVTFEVGIFINEYLISTSAISLGPSQSLTVVGFTSQQNGTYTVSIRARVGPPWPDKLANVLSSIVLMSGKR